MLWSQVIAQWSLDGLYDQVDPDSVAYNLNAAGRTNLRDARAQARIDRMANFYKNKIEVQLQQEYPSDLRSMRTFIERRKAQQREFQSYAQSVAGAGDAVGPQFVGAIAFPSNSALWTPSDGIYGVTEVRPRLFYVEGPVTNALLVGEADNGEYLAVTSMAGNAEMPPQLLYINRGSKASPLWQAWDPVGLIDYIADPTPILACGYERVKYYIHRYATDGDEGDRNERIEMMPKVAKQDKDDLTEEEEVAFKLLDIDLSGDGIISDAERGGQSIRKWVF